MSKDKAWEDPPEGTEPNYSTHRGQVAPPDGRRQGSLGHQDSRKLAMIHKKSGMPSKDWLMAYLRRYVDQRVTFELATGSMWHELLISHGAFSQDRSIWVSGVFSGLHKRPKDWPKLFAAGPATLFLRFRKPVFKQGDRFVRSPLARSHYDHKRSEIEFELSEIRGLRLAERLSVLTPRLGHTPGRISCSEGSLGTGFPSKQELALPSRGSDSTE